jgi:hypothetical protein
MRRIEGSEEEAIGVVLADGGGIKMEPNPSD